jgi:hypothetical protein
LLARALTIQAHKDQKSSIVEVQDLLQHELAGFLYAFATAAL